MLAGRRGIAKSAHSSGTDPGRLPAPDYANLEVLPASVLLGVACNTIVGRVAELVELGVPPRERTALVRLQQPFAP